MTTQQLVHKSLDLVETVMDQFIKEGGTPEEFGEMLYDATKTLHLYVGINGRERTQFHKDTQTAARKKIRSYNHGQEFLDIEIKLIQQFSN